MKNNISNHFQHKKIALVIALLLFIAVLLCGYLYSRPKVPGKYQVEFFDLFDTVVTITGYANTQEEFTIMSNEINARLTELTMLFDIYHTYEGLNNLKTINQQAGKSPVAVDDILIDFIELSKEAYRESRGSVNIAMGSVLSIWHDYRTRGIANPEAAALPPMDLLLAASKHTDIETINTDREKGTVFIEDPEVSIDAGAVAKGFAAELVCQEMIEKGYDSFILSLGGNIRVVGSPKEPGRETWSVGIQDPSLTVDSVRNILDTLSVNNDVSVVSSGDYQRFYTVDGKRYNHIIDPTTLLPAQLYKQVSVVCPDSGWADILSTALYILPLAEGEELIQRHGGEALWITISGEAHTTPGYQLLSENFN